MEPNKNTEIDLSIVIPVYNEEANIIPLYDELKSALSILKKSYEIIFVDDGSKDATFERLEKLSSVTIIRFRRNFGKTAALSAGFEVAKGNIIITLDGDLQNDPADLPRFLAKLDEGWDVVCGWRKNRHDTFSKKLFSRGANLLRHFFVKDQIHDSTCGFHSYRKEVLEGLELFGDTHRFIPAIVRNRGFKVTEIVINHRERVAGKTKYNYKRLLKGVVDLVSVWFWYSYSSKPIHLFGGAGVLLFGFGITSALVLAILRIAGLIYLHNRIWPLVSFFSILAGIQFLFFGLLAEIAIHTYYSKERKPYLIKEIIETSNHE